MTLTQRQEKILERIVKEHIRSASPVSSKFLCEKYDFGISPATMRIEMQRLADQGYLYQPHTSAGRIPTDKGYRFFVDKLLKKGYRDFVEEKKKKIIEEVREEMKNSIKLVQAASRVIAENSTNLGMSYLLEEDIFWKEGWKDVLSKPEFQEMETTSDFIRMIEEFEKHIKDILPENYQETRVYIGRENPLSRSNEFSIITAGFICPELGCRGILAILGPKRMNYNRNISLINFLTHFLYQG
ncbi:hypothetical protein J7K24_02335 [bacterium]|nr:hypothetical protein [bacterium]